MATTFDAGKPTRRPIRSEDVACAWIIMEAMGVVYFPQHGPGRKHKRKIELASWQENDTWTQSPARSSVD